MDKHIEELKNAEWIYYAGSIYKFAEVKEFPHGKMIGIYDEPPGDHIDYIQPSSAYIGNNCNACQGQGCPTCQGYGFIVYPNNVSK